LFLVYIWFTSNADKIAILPARRVVVQAIDHGAVTVLQHGPTVGVLHVRPHPDAEQEHHAPVPAIFQSDVELCAGFIAKRGRWHEEDIVHPHFVVVAPERPAVDKLHAEKVLVPDIQAAEDLNLGPVKAASGAQEAARSLHNAPHQPSNLMPMQLIVPPVCGRQLDPTTKPVAAKVVQVTGNFPPKVFENRVFNDVV